MNYEAKNVVTEVVTNKAGNTRSQESLKINTSIVVLRKNKLVNIIVNRYIKKVYKYKSFK